VALVVAMGLVLICAAGALFYLNKRQVNVAVVSIGIDFFQVLAIFATMGVKWPPVVLNLMRFLSAFNLNIEIVAPECLIPNLSYIQKFGFIMLMPISIAALFCLLYSWLWFWKKCVRGIKDRRKVQSHRPALISSLLILTYLMYLYITRTCFDILDCTPTVPPDGYNYLKVVFERCGVPGGTQLTLLAPALIGLGFYTFGYPYYLGRTLYRNRELVMEDQLLRAKGVGDDRLTNPNALDMRRMYGRSYFQFRPEKCLWIEVIIARKFCIACVAVIFSNSVGFQMASCLMIMFLAYTLQVQFRPYMCSDDYADVLKQHRDAAAKGDPLAVRLKATLDAIKSRGRKTTTGKTLLSVFQSVSSGAAFNRKEAMKALSVWMFNYNTVEAVMSFSAVIVCLSGLMYQAELTRSTGLRGTLDAITGLIMFIVIFAILYFCSALGYEIYNGVVGFRRELALRKSSKHAVIASSVGGEGNDDTANIEAQVNPMFLSDGGDKANLGADKESLVASILAQKEAPPLQLWLVFRDEFASLVERLKETGEKAALGAAAIQKLETMNALALGAKSKGGRKEFDSVMASPRTPLESTTSTAAFTGTNPLKSSASLRSGGGVMASLRESLGATAASPGGFKASSSSSSKELKQSLVLGGGEFPSPSSFSSPKSAKSSPLESPGVENPLLSSSGSRKGSEKGGGGISAVVSGDDTGGVISVPGLPAGWSARLTSKGKTMYWCEETGVTTYKLDKIPGYVSSEPPPAAASPPLSKETVEELPPPLTGSPPQDDLSITVPGLPEGWAARKTSKGKTMYWNEATGETTTKLEKVPGYLAPHTSE